MAAAGGGLGAAGFIVLDDRVDIVAVAHGVSRFLSVESCGQCTPCKQDGLAITDVARPAPARRRPTTTTSTQLPQLAARVTDGARCYLAQQHQNVVQSLLARFPDALAAHADGRAPRRRLVPDRAAPRHRRRPARPRPRRPRPRSPTGPTAAAPRPPTASTSAASPPADAPDRTQSRIGVGSVGGVTVLGAVLAAGRGSGSAPSGGDGPEAAGRGRRARRWSPGRWRRRSAAGLDEVVVVAGAVDLPAPGLPVAVLDNPRWAEGIATSLQVAVRHAEAAGHDAVVVGPGRPARGHRGGVAGGGGGRGRTADRGGHLRRPARQPGAARPVACGPSSPTTGDEGARALIRRRPELVQAVPCDGRSDDIDTLEDLDRWS